MAQKLGLVTYLASIYFDLKQYEKYIAESRVVAKLTGIASDGSTSKRAPLSEMLREC